MGAERTSMNRFLRKSRRISKVALLVAISLIVGTQPAYPVLAVETPPDNSYKQDPSRLPTLLGEGLAYYIPGDACSAGQAPGGAATADGHTLPASVGGTGFEDPITPDGRIINKDGSLGGHIAFANNVQKASTTPIAGDPESRSMQQLYQQYYINMRWRYALWNWDGSARLPGPETVDFYSKAPKILVTNKRNGKRIIAVVLETGPAPWTGVDTGVNNNPKQGWTNPQDGTPSGYKGRVSGFPPRAIADLDAKQRMQDGSGDDLVYEWAPDQNALPGPIQGVQPEQSVDASACPGDGGVGNVNTDGYSWPVADQKKHSYGTAPCSKRTCHHDGTAAFDLMYGKDGNMDGKAVYAITAGTIQKLSVYHGVEGCHAIQFKSDMTNGKGNYFYWYGHLQNPKVTQGQHVAAGQQIAEVGAYSLGSDCRGGRDHLHIDRGCIEGGIPQTGGSDGCRDPAFVPLMNSLWNQLQP